MKLSAVVLLLLVVVLVAVPPMDATQLCIMVSTLVAVVLATMLAGSPVANDGRRVPFIHPRVSLQAGCWVQRRGPPLAV